MPIIFVVQPGSRKDPYKVFVRDRVGEIGIREKKNLESPLLEEVHNLRFPPALYNT